VKIKTKIVKEGDKKRLEIRCPECNKWLFIIAKKEQLTDFAACGICGCQFWWSIQE